MSQHEMSQSQTVDDGMSQTVDENTDENKLKEVVRDKWMRIHQQYSNNGECLVFYQIYCTEKTVEKFETGPKQNETTKGDGSHFYEVAYTQSFSSVIRVTKRYLEGGVEKFCLKDILGNNPALSKFYDAFGRVDLRINNPTSHQLYVKTKNIKNMKGVTITFDDENILKLDRGLSGHCVCLNHAGDQSVLTCKVFTRVVETSTPNHEHLVESMFTRLLPSESQECQTQSDLQDESADAGNTQDEPADAGNTQDESADAGVETNETGNTQDEPADAGSKSVEPADVGLKSVEPADAGSKSVEPADVGLKSVEPADAGSKSVEPADAETKEAGNAEDESPDAGTNEAETTTPKTNEAETTTAPRNPVVIRSPTKRHRGVKYASTDTESPTKKAATSEPPSISEGRTAPIATRRALPDCLKRGKQTNRKK